MKRLYFLLSLVMTVFIAGAQTVTDVITANTFSTSNVSEATKLRGTTESGNEYEVFAPISSLLGSRYISLNPVSTNGGIVAVKAEGIVKSVRCQFGTFTGGSAVLDIYGAHEPFAVADMYSGNGKCQVIGSVTKSNPATSIEGEWEYIGVRSKTGTIYLVQLTIEYDNTPAWMPRVNYTVGSGGTMTVTLPEEDNKEVKSGEVLNVGQTVQFDVKANKSYVIEALTVNGETLAPATYNSAYTLSLTANEGVTLNVNVTFKAIQTAKATVTFSAGEGGKITAVDCTDYLPLESGQKIDTPHNVAFVATPEEGYSVGTFKVNGVVTESPVIGQTLTNLILPVIEDIEVSVDFVNNNVEYCNNYEGLKNDRTDRHVDAIRVSCGDETLDVTGIQGSAGTKDIYQDKTDNVLDIKPGETINFKVTQAVGSWMHGYVWVDWNNDGVFTSDIQNNAVTPASELVAYNFYGPYSENSGRDSNGNPISNEENGYKADYNFTVPSDLLYGDYRLRFIIAWNNINPCGPVLTDKDRLDVTGGVIVDVTLRYADPNATPGGEEKDEATVTFSATDGGTITAVDCTDYLPLRIGQKVKTSHVVAFVAVPDQDYIVDHFEVDGEVVESIVPGQELTNLMLTITDDINVKAVFVVDPETRTYCNNYEGIKTSTTTDNGKRYLGSITLTCGSESIKVADLQKAGGNADIYFDRTDQVLDVTPGATVTLKAGDTNSTWMHGYVWVDWNKDKDFTAEFNGNAVSANSELVAFTYYNGYGSAGNYIGSNNNGSLAANGYQANLTFTVPSDLATGNYRLRYIVAWENINPCGPELSDKNSLDKQGGSITDITLHCVSSNSAPAAGLETIEVAAQEAAPVYYNLQGVRVANPTTGVYIMVRGDKAEKVYLNR